MVLIIFENKRRHCRDTKALHKEACVAILATHSVKQKVPMREKFSLQLLLGVNEHFLIAFPSSISWRSEAESEIIALSVLQINPHVIATKKVIIQSLRLALLLFQPHTDDATEGERFCRCAQTGK